MAVRFLTQEDVAKLAKSVWYAPRTKATKCSDRKIGTFPAFGLADRSTEFPMRSGEWMQAGTLEMMIEYPMWDIPGKMHVRKIQEGTK